VVCDVDQSIGMFTGGGVEDFRRGRTELDDNFLFVNEDIKLETDKIFSLFFIDISFIPFFVFGNMSKESGL
jgi:hypothetical protein